MTDETTAPAEMPEDQAAALAALEAAAAAPETAPAVTVTGTATPSVDVIEESRMLCNMAADGVSALYPILKYTPDTRERVAVALAPVLQKYNITSDLFARWGVEINLALTLGTVVYQSVLAYRAASAQATPAVTVTDTAA